MARKSKSMTTPRLNVSLSIFCVPSGGGPSEKLTIYIDTGCCSI